MRLHILLLITAFGSSLAMFENSRISLSATQNVSCLVKADLIYLNGMVPSSAWDFLNRTASTINVFPNLPTLLNQLRSLQNVWTLNQSLSVPSVFDFCFVVNVDSNLTNGTTLTNTVAGGFVGYNIFKHYVQGRCSAAQFSPTVTPIGYGACDPIPFLMYSNRLCVCSTNNCNADYATCVASAQLNRSVTLSNILINMPEQNNLTSCQDGFQGLTYILHSMARTQLQATLNLYNVTGLLGIQNRLSACGILHNADTGDWFRFRLGFEEYSLIFFARMILRHFNMYTAFAETATSIAVRHPCVDAFRALLYSTIQYFSQVVCICTTNDCNSNIETCAVAMNMSSIVRTVSTVTQSTTSDGSNLGDGTLMKTLLMSIMAYFGFKLIF